MSTLMHILSDAGIVHFLADASSVIKNSATSACGTSCNYTSVQAIFKGIANALIFLVGAISVIMIIVGGFRYVISNGDSKNISAAKDTVLYAVVGVVVAIAAYAIVTFVTARF